MPKNPLKVGDRVHAYGHGEFDKQDTVTLTGELNVYGEYPAVSECGHKSTVHPKQCRRLRPKAKAEPVWVLECPTGAKCAYIGDLESCGDDVIYHEYRRVRTIRKDGAT